MLQFLISILSFLVAISVLVAVHEWGHFWVARRFGIKVLRFSIGFGRPFFRWYDKLGTEYVLSSIPLGGYVALFGERDTGIPESQRHQAFAYKPVGVRMMVLFAGPFANILLAIAAYWLMFMIGIGSLLPVIGNVTPGSIAALGGLKTGEEVISIDNKPTRSWEAVSVALLKALGTEQTIAVVTKPFNKTFTTKLGVEEAPEVKAQSAVEIAAVETSAVETSHTLDLSSLIGQEKEPDLLKELGITPFDPYPPLVYNVIPDNPAANAGIQKGDRIIAINGHPVISRSEVTEKVQASINETLTFEVLRNKEKKPIVLKIQPITKRLEDGKMIGFLGVEYDPTVPIPKEMQSIEKFGPWSALTHAVQRTIDYTLLTFSTLKKMLVGTVSVKSLSGPISIAQYAGLSAMNGFQYFLSFLAVISISLGVINILPIPILDGGHLMYCVYELLTGKKVSEHAQSIGMVIGGIILLFVMIIAFYNDIVRF